MNDTPVIKIPIDRRSTTHLPVNNVNGLHILGPMAFKDAIRHTAPCVIGGKLHFNPEIPQNDVRKSIRMRIKIDLKPVGLNKFLQNLPHSKLKILGFAKGAVYPALR